MKKMPSEKAQSSAPFEVLIAVIIMGFVLYMGYQAVIYLSEEQCKAGLKEQAANLKAKVQEAVNGNSVLLNFFPPTCFQRTETEMRLTVVSSSARCSSICGKTQGECLFLTYRSGNYAYDLCFDNAPTYTTFLTGNPCPLQTGFDLKDFRNPDQTGTNADGQSKNSIPSGVYNIQNITGSSENVPKLCAYLRTGR